VQALAERATAKNRELEVTGRLVAENGTFVQVIEGTRSVIGHLYRAIEADTRHHTLLCVLDREFDGRSYKDWTTLLPQASQLDRDAFSDRLQGPVATPDLGVNMPNNSFAALSQTRIGLSLLERLRVVPRQPRASQTVDQIFTASEAAIKRDGLGTFSLDRVAQEAKVTSAAAYRYFTSTDNLLRAMARRRQVIGYNDALEEIARTTFRSEREVAEWLVDGMVRRITRASRIHPPTFRRLYRDYNEMFLEGMWHVAEALLQAMTRGGAPSAHIGVQDLYLALAGFAASLKAAFLHEAALLHSTALRAALIGGFLGTLNAAAAERDLPRV
jgi:AcrR family transcriptional regulator